MTGQLREFLEFQPCCLGAGRAWRYHRASLRVPMGPFGNSAPFSIVRRALLNSSSLVFSSLVSKTVFFFVSFH
jgi:hypothetical protein